MTLRGCSIYRLIYYTSVTDDNGYQKWNILLTVFDHIHLDLHPLLGIYFNISILVHFNDTHL
jgi:hypothetical protein